jgi:hemolysin activation/secretion protein
VELRSPSLSRLFHAESLGEWRLHAFVDAAQVKIQQPLPAQKSRFELLAAGVGTRVRLRDRFTGSLDAGWPLFDEGQTKAGDVRVNFSIGAKY